ncbi:MAG: TldD/PmbA family protein [Pseudomonadota bacterium]
MQDEPTLETLTARLLDAAARAGASAADAMAIRGTSLGVEVRGGALEQAERSEAVDIGLRVFDGTRSASVSASDISDATIAAMAERAVAMAREAPEDPYAGLAEPGQIAAEADFARLELADPSAAPSPEYLQDRALEAEAAARDVDGVTQVSDAAAYANQREVAMAGTNGIAFTYERTDHGQSCTAIAGTGLGMERDYDGDGRIFAADLRAPVEIGARAGARAVERVGARKPPTGAYPVLYDERISASLIGHLLSAINGQSIARGASWLRDAMGQTVLPDGVDLIEDPHRPRTQGSRAVDGEGLATQRRALVEGGVLQGWVLDLAAARKLGLEPTANAARNLSGGIGPMPWNIALSQGTASKDDLIADMGTGLLVTSMIGATINPNTGDYSRGAAGLWVENGQIAYPVNECTIAGNLRDMLRGLVPANDARPYLSRVVPSLLVQGMTIAGS